MEIDEDEYTELEAEVSKIDPYTGKVAKFHMDKFYGKDMELSRQILSEDVVKSWLDWLEQTLPDHFKRNSDLYMPMSLGKPDPRPMMSFDQFLGKAEEAMKKATEADKLAKKKKKERLNEFMYSIRQYLDSLPPEELSKHRWSDPNYKSPYNPKTRRLIRQTRQIRQHENNK